MRLVSGDEQVTLWHGDCLQVLAELNDASIDAVVTDPPYGLEFMGKDWDRFAGAVTDRDFKGFVLSQQRTRNVKCPECGKWAYDHPGRLCECGGIRRAQGNAFQQWCEAWAAECLRVLKPGGHMLAFGGTRTYHRLAVAVEDAGFEIRDSIAWLYGSGFPKSLDVSKAIDRVAGAEREIVGRYQPPNGTEWNLANDTARATVGAVGHSSRTDSLAITAPATDAAKQWQGWGTALKPAFEPLVCARKPFNPVPLDWRLVTDVHHALAGLLWLSLSPAKRAESHSQSKNPEQHGAWCASARVSAALGTSPDAYAATATFNSQAAESTCLSIASSWSAILAALSDPMSTCTTSTKSSTTTGLRILNSLLAPITSLSTMPPCGCLLDGPSSPATNAADALSDEWARWMHTLSASAPESVIAATANAVCNVLASIADELSTDPVEASSAPPSATTGAVSSHARSAFEPIVVARKPIRGTVAGNVVEHGTGALNIDACRVATSSEGPGTTPPSSVEGQRGSMAGPMDRVPYDSSKGRWPTNVVLDGDAADELDQQSGVLTSGANPTRRGSDKFRTAYGDFEGQTECVAHRGADSGGASRFFPTFRYEAKAPTAERPTVNGVAHPTVKPLELMRWLVRLVTPPGGTVLDPFAGSGTTAEACIHEHLHCITIEREADYLPLIQARLSKPMEIGFNFGEGA